MREMLKMAMISDNDLLFYNQQGLIPGPQEDEISFLRRVEYCLSIRKNLAGKLPFTHETEEKSDSVNCACIDLKKLYDCAPYWVPVFYSNYQLLPWHGGCAWIFQFTDHDPTSAFFQLRKQFHHSSTYLGIYQRDELMAHEMAHVGRMLFNEPRYEEFLAYRTSKHPWRRWLGPLVQSAQESAWFVFLLMPLIFLDIYLFASGQETLYWNLMWLKLIPLMLLCFAFARLWKNHLIFNRTLKKLKNIWGEACLPILYRLTDDEIINFSRMSPGEIKDFSNKNETLRWKTIRLAYVECDSKNDY